MSSVLQTQLESFVTSLNGLTLYYHTNRDPFTRPFRRINETDRNKFDDSTYFRIYNMVVTANDYERVNVAAGSSSLYYKAATVDMNIVYGFAQQWGTTDSNENLLNRYISEDQKQIIETLTCANRTSGVRLFQWVNNTIEPANNDMTMFNKNVFTISYEE